MKYEIIRKSWSKRRKLDTPKEVTDIQFTNFLKQHDHFCTMQVTYSNGENESLISRVIFNEIKRHWIIDGMKLAVRIIE